MVPVAITYIMASSSMLLAFGIPSMVIKKSKKHGKAVCYSRVSNRKFKKKYNRGLENSEKGDNTEKLGQKRNFFQKNNMQGGG